MPTRKIIVHLSPDAIVYWQFGLFKLNATIVFTWVIMLVLVVGSKWVTRNLSMGLERTRWQNLLEIVVTGMTAQIADIGLRNARIYLPFLGTLFLFLATVSLATITLDNHRARALRVCRDSVLWH